MYEVELGRTLYYTVVVDAADEEDAKACALELFEESLANGAVYEHSEALEVVDVTSSEAL